MSRSANYFDEFQPHSRHKLKILEHYFQAWGHKLGLRDGSGQRILYVDACAGKGKDKRGNPGSPLIAAKAAAIAQASVGHRRGSAFKIQVIAIESRAKLHKALESNLGPYGEGARALKGTLEQHMSEIESEFPDIPALYFVDPFGLKPLKADLISRVLEGDKHETLVLFADQAALRHFGAATKQETAAEKRHRKQVSEHADQPGFLFPHLKAERDRETSELAVRAAASRESLSLTREHAVAILNTAFGETTWLDTIANTPPNCRRQKFLELYVERLRLWKAEYILPILILNNAGDQVYTLIHASKSGAAYTAMKEAVEYAFKESPLPEWVVADMRADAKCDLDQVECSVLTRFAGQTVQWAEDPTDRKSERVRRFVLAETPIFPFQLEELKSRLLPYKTPGRKIVYSFPPALA